MTIFTIAMAAASLAATDTEADLSWLEGCWEGEGLGGEVVECWMGTPDGYWSGMFQLTVEGQLIFTEYFQLADFDTGRELRLNHFDREMATWEDAGEHTVFPFIEADGSSLIFSGMAYRLTGPDQMRVEVQLDNDGDPVTAGFDYTRR
ncbi:MAG: hypothetical protein DHS20C06_10180 [Hyphobacterium sp.]|nr:MAG: hypothetical protein DHS20C06_10180 [Hyphobacterium sp.]